MSTMNELGLAVRQRRADMGLTQSGVARLSGLSRTTVNQIEKGTLRNLSLNRAYRLADALGLQMNVTPARKAPAKEPVQKLTALEKAALMGSISYKTSMTGERLQKILLQNEAPKEFQPHLRALLEETPTSLLASVVEQIHAEHGLERSTVWSRMRGFAHSVQTYRELWH